MEQSQFNRFLRMVTKTAEPVVNKSTVTGKINELEHKNELDVRKTQEAILTPGTQMYLVPPRRLSAYHGGSLPNISYAGSCEDFFNDQAPHMARQSSPSPIRHERSASPRAVPFPSAKPKTLSADAAKNSKRPYFLPVPRGYSTATKSSSDSNLSGQASTVPGPYDSYAPSPEQFLPGERRNSYHDTFNISVPQFGTGQRSTPQIPVPSVPDMPWNKPKSSQESQYFIPVPNTHYMPNRCSCGGSTAPTFTRTTPLQHPMRENLLVSQNGASQHHNFGGLNFHNFDQNGHGRGRAASEHNASTGLSQESTVFPFSGRGFALTVDPPPNNSQQISPSSSFANLRLDLGGIQQNSAPIPQDDRNFIPVPQCFARTLRRQSFSEPLIDTLGGYHYAQDFFAEQNIPSVVITEPPRPETPPLSPNTEALQRVLLEFLGEPSKNEPTQNGYDLPNYSFGHELDELLDEDLTILDEIARNGLQGSATT